MKDKVTILLLLFFVSGYGQVRVPDTETFSLQDVYNAVSDHASPSANLSSCFANAESGYFDPVYEGSKDRLTNFRNYGPMIPEFIVITSDYKVALLDINGNFKYASPTYYASIPTNSSDYDQINKILMYITQGGYLGVVDGNDLLNLRCKQLINYTYINISKTTDYWFASIDNNRNGKYGSLASYQTVSLLNDIFGSTPQTSGNLRKFIKHPTLSSIHYYSTDADEIGSLNYVGGSGTELHDSDTHPFSEITYQNGVFLAFGETRRSRYSTNLSDWSDFYLSDISGITVRRALPYTSSYSIALAGGKVYRVSHANPPVTTDITPSGYSIYSISVSGSYVYAAAVYSGTYRILRASLGSTSWSVYMDNIPTLIVEAWKY